MNGCYVKIFINPNKKYLTLLKDERHNFIENSANVYNVFSLTFTMRLTIYKYHSNHVLKLSMF